MSIEETHLVQAETHLRKGEFSDALRVFREVLERVRDKDPAIKVAALMGMGKVYYTQGDFGLAETCQRDALGIVQTTPELHRLCASILHSIGQVRLMISDPQGAYDHFADAMRLFTELGDLPGEAGVLLDLGNLFSVTRRYEDASKALDRALTLFQQLGARPRQGDIYLAFGSIYLAQANFSEAFKVYSSARMIFNETGEKAKEGLAINNLGSLRYIEGAREEGISLMEQALDIFMELGDKQTQAFIMTKLAGLHQQQRELHKASELIQRALQIFREIGHEKGIQVTSSMSQEIDKDIVDDGK